MQKFCMLRSATWHHSYRSLGLRPVVHTRPFPSSARRPRFISRCAAQVADEQPVSVSQQFVLWLIANGALQSNSVLSPGSGTFSLQAACHGVEAMRMNALCAGVEGISPGSSKAALYEADSGERGVLCTQVGVFAEFTQM